jgi:Rps23 Pro-64 3,4-dihydroxylase Tpa1-like proline 4-hydroxylase
MKNLNPMELASGLTNELLEVIYKYEDAMMLPTVLGILDVVKFELMLDHHNLCTEEDDD